MTKIAAIAALILTACLTAEDSPLPDAGEVPDAGPDPVAQCRELVGYFCVSADRCSTWDPNSPACAEHVGDACERNQTALSPLAMARAVRAMEVFDCVDDERGAVWPDERGMILLDAMLAWPAAAR